MCESSDDESKFTFEDTPLDFEETSTSKKQFLPQKSKLRYDKIYSIFKLWLKLKHTSKISENVTLAFFTEKSEIWNSSSLWTNYSMLKSSLMLYDNIDISKFSKLILFLKRSHTGYTPKKSKILEREDIVTFLREAPNEQFLMMKVVIIMGISGACRTSELVAMKITDVEDRGTLLVVKIPDRKTNAQRTFIVTNENNLGLDLLQFYHEYVLLRPPAIETERLFLRYSNGQCCRQVVGKNIFSKIPQVIAKFLQLPNASLYTGHCFKRTSASLLANKCSDLVPLNALGDWKSPQISEIYIEDSLSNKKIEAKSILNESSTDSIQLSAGHSHNIILNNCSNITVNIKKCNCSSNK
ncbi:hypothetical protein AMK59_1694 [Oryctes borbonicus]|uniref:Tyr recombinase domain-containing protein n=1 Tax=Oryctes borbonicus TaxID=1629725 RepID=A0A0T6BHJ5_9SCAR|nr:hypothetical protein AMK59_1694 [Oryctes borbonicus]